MTKPLVLCDPGLLLPPADEVGPRVHRQFWLALVAWAADRRVLLGIQSRRAIWEKLDEMGWPDYLPPHCPDSLTRDARRAFTALLTAIAADPPLIPTDIPSLEPKYALDEDLGTALALDIAEHGADHLVGAASKYDHWTAKADVVNVTPPPPEKVRLLIEPGESVDGEVDLRVANALRGKRLTVVGGKHANEVVTCVCGRFKIETSQLRWLEAEPKKHARLEGLRGVRPEKDVVVCITGAISHPDSEKVLRRSRRGGLEPILVEKRSEIEAALCLRFGRSGSR